MAGGYDRLFDVKRQPGEFFDWSTFLITLLLVTIGLISIYSATYEAGMSSRFTQQLVYAFLGFSGVIVIMFLPERWLYDAAYPIYSVIVLTLIIVLFFGKEVNGTKGWMSLGFMTFQPAEFAKLGTLLGLARFLSSKGIDIKNLRDLLITVAIVLLPAFLIYKQPDHGTATVIVALLLGVLFWSGFDLFLLFTIISIPVISILSLFGFGMFVAALSIYSVLAGIFRRKIYITVISILLVGAISYSSKVVIDKLEPYQQKRIQTFLNPGADPRGSGYNVIQSILAVGNGGLSGRGFMSGSQTQLKYIPAQWTDFIFSVPAEEFGFIGAVSVIVLMILFIIRSVSIASETSSTFFSIISFGTATIVFYHTSINIGMAIGLTPVMGIPLPFLSSGGSALLSNLALVGLMLNSFRTHRRKKLV
jgi:rod shape determining protein RodA